MVGCLSRGCVAAAVARRRDQDSGRDGEAQQLEQHALPAPEHHWLKSQEGREATRELESLSKRPDGGDAQPLQQLMEGQPEGAGMQVFMPRLMLLHCGSPASQMSLLFVNCSSTQA